MSTYQHGDDTVVMPPARAAVPPPDPSPAPPGTPPNGFDPDDVQEAAYAIDYGAPRNTLPPSAQQAYDRLRASGYPHNKAVYGDTVKAAAPAKEDRSKWPVAIADGMAVGALITSLFGFSVVGIILGAIHMSNAHKKRERASAVGCWGLGLGIAGLAAEVIIVILFIAALASIGSAAASTGY